MHAFALSGLIVGAVIKYTSSLPKKVTRETVTALNFSGVWSEPPDYIWLKVPIDYNDTHTMKYYHYAFVSHVEPQEPSEPELEEKASCYFMCYFTYILAVDLYMFMLGLH